MNHVNTAKKEPINQQWCFYIQNRGSCEFKRMKSNIYISSFIEKVQFTPCPITYGCNTVAETSLHLPAYVSWWKIAKSFSTWPYLVIFFSLASFCSWLFLGQVQVKVQCLVDGFLQMGQLPIENLMKITFKLFLIIQVSLKTHHSFYVTVQKV